MGHATSITTADGLTIVGEVDGPDDAPVVLLVGGTTQVRGLYAPIVAGLAGRYRVITYDGRDVGESSRCPAGYTSEQLADDAVAVLDAFGADAAAVAGISLGGCVALQVGRRHPDRAWALAVGSCWARVDRHLESQFRLWIDLMESAGFGMVFRLMSFMAFSAETQELLGDMSALASIVESSTDTPAFRRQVEADLTHSLSDDDLRTIGAPALVLWGDQDLIVPRRYAEQLAAAIPDARCEGLSPVSHSMMADHPDQLISALLGWFDQHRPGPR